MKKINVGILCYDLQDGTMSLFNRISEAVNDECRITVYPLGDKIAGNKDLRFDIKRGVSVEKYKIFSLSKKGVTMEAMLLRPNIKHAVKCAIENNVILHYGLHSSTALMCAVIAKIFMHKQISVNIALPSEVEMKRIWYVKILKKMMLKLCDAHIYQTMTTQKTLKKVYGINKSVYAPFDAGVSVLYENDDGDSDRNDKQEIFTFLFVGNLIYLKGVKELILAAKRMKQNGAIFNVIIVGPESVAEDELKINEWQEYVDENELTAEVLIVGPVDYLFLKKYYMSADVLVIPSHRETWLKVVMEASYYRLPSIVTTACSVADGFIEDGYNGFVCEPNNVNDLYLKMNYAYQNREGLKEVGRNARKTLDNFWSPKNEIDAYKDTIMNIAKEDVL